MGGTAMTNYTKTLTETLTPSDSTHHMRPTEPSLSIDGVLLNDNWESIEIIKRLNEIWAGTIHLANISASQHTHVQEGKTVQVYIGTTKIYQGEIDHVNYNETGRTKVYVLNMRPLRNFDFRALSNGIYRETSSTQADTIVSKILSENVDGSSPFIIQTGTNDITTSTTFRVEGDTNRYQALQHIATLVDGEFWEDQDGSGNDEINFTATKGASSSQKTFTTTGSSQNADVAQRFVDESQLWNKITVRGYAEGNSRVEATASDNSSISTYGERQKVHVDTRIRGNGEAQELADKILADHKDPIERYTLVIDDIEQVLPGLVIGDTITIEDPNIYETDTSDKDFRIIAMRLNFSQAQGLSVLLECASKTLSFSADFLTAQTKIAEEQQRAQNETHEDTTQSTNQSSTTESVNTNSYQTQLTGLTTILDSGQESSSQGHSSSTKTSSINSDVSIPEVISDSGSDSITTSWKTLTTFNPGNNDVLGLYISFNGMSFGTGAFATLFFQIEDTTTGEYFPGQFVNIDMTGPDASTTATICVTYAATIMLPPSATGDSLEVQVQAANTQDNDLDWNATLYAFGAHTHDIDSTSLNGLVLSNKLSYDENSGGTPQAALNTSSQQSDTLADGESTANRASSDNLDKRQKSNFS